MFSITRFIAVFFLFYSINISGVFEIREWMLSISIFVFFVVSYFYQRRVGFFSLSYIFYFMVCFLSFNVYSYLYIYNEHILSLDYDKIWVPSDYYQIYFIVFLLVSFSVFIYLLLFSTCKKKLIYISKIDKGLYPDRFFLCLSFCVLFISLLFDFKNIYILQIPIFCFSVFRSLLYKNNFFSIMSFFLNIYILIMYLEQRFILIQFVFPIVMGTLVILDIKYNFRNLSLFKILMGFIALVGGVIMYGIISEIYKLNKYWGGGYDIEYVISIFNNWELLYDWSNRQLYRIFQIWTHLSSNMIEYVNYNDFLYGSSLLSTLLGDNNHIKLAELSAELIGASYAQPGSFGEGYINFGIAGACLNLVVMFFIIEFSVLFFLKKKSLFTFILMITPFTKIILDGGTVISALIIMIGIFMINLISFRSTF